MRAELATIGFEYWANPKNPDEGFITWQTEGKPRVTMGASAVGADQGTDGAMISKRLIPEEPMVWNDWLSIHTTHADHLHDLVHYPQLGYLRYELLWLVTSTSLNWVRLP